MFLESSGGAPFAVVHVAETGRVLHHYAIVRHAIAFRDDENVL